MGGILMVSVPNVVKFVYQVIYSDFPSHTEYTTTVKQGLTATGGWIAKEGRFLRRVRNRSVLGNASKLLLPHLLAPNEVKAQVFSQPAERAPPQ